MLKINKLAKTYHAPRGATAALDGATLSMSMGDFVAVRGPSGCGKTTLLMAAGGLLVPDRGTVEFDEKNIYAMSSEKRTRFRAENIGFVFQQFHLIPYLNVIGNILAPTIARQTEGATPRAKELIKRFNLSGRIYHLPAELSTGERQRTAMARALLNGPKLILADEPTGNLDKENADVLLEHLKEFCRGGGMVLLVTHDQRVAKKAGRVMIMKDGKLGA